MALVVFGGLPGTGKTTIARALAIRLGATYLRIDIIEQSIRSAGVLAAEVGPAGYFVANALAASNLANGLSVVESRDGWRGTASRAGAPLIEVEVVCSDRDEHRRRVEGRGTDIEGLVLPTWQSVLEREFAPWPEPHLLIDTASLTPEEAVALVKRTIDEIQGAT